MTMRKRIGLVILLLFGIDLVFLLGVIGKEIVPLEWQSKVFILWIFFLLGLTAPLIPLCLCWRPGDEEE